MVSTSGLAEYVFSIKRVKFPNSEQIFLYKKYLVGIDHAIAGYSNK